MPFRAVVAGFSTDGATARLRGSSRGSGDVLWLEALIETQVLASPYPGLPAPVVASSWGKQLRLESATDPRLEQFVRAFRLGPEAPEPGAPCTGGTGTPG